MEQPDLSLKIVLAKNERSFTGQNPPGIGKTSQRHTKPKTARSHSPAYPAGRRMWNHRGKDSGVAGRQVEAPKYIVFRYITAFLFDRINRILHHNAPRF